jgi:hypothetical protein
LKVRFIICNLTELMNILLRKKTGRPEEMAAVFFQKQILLNAKARREAASPA